MTGSANPAALILPPAANGYRRSLQPGRAVSIYYDRHPPNEWGEHVHELDQISMLLESADCIIRHQGMDGTWHERTVDGSAVWVVPRGMPHALRCPKETDMVTLFADQAFVREVVDREAVEFLVAPLPQLESRDPLIGQLAPAFRRLCRGESASALYVESIGTVLAAHVLQALYSPRPPEAQQRGLPDETLQRVARHIDEHLAEKLDLATLGRFAGFSSSHFGRLFRKSLGRTPHDYVMRRRVARARELLESTNKKEIEIAGDCGFSDETLMARWFRRVLACRPSDCRPPRRR